MNGQTNGWAETHLSAIGSYLMETIALPLRSVVEIASEAAKKGCEELFRWVVKEDYEYVIYDTGKIRLSASIFEWLVRIRSVRLISVPPDCTSRRQKYLKILT